MTTINPFLAHRFSCHAVGNLMTCLPGLTEKQQEERKALQDRANGIGRPLTELQGKRLEELTLKENGKDELPAGAISYLDDVYRSIVWKREDILENVFLEKGLHVEQDCLDLVSRTDGRFYAKNAAIIAGDYLIGTPDVRYFAKSGIKHIIDTKASWDLKTFDKATLTSIYEWQVKAYMWLDRAESGEVAFCLVNAPAHLVEKEIERMWYRMGQPSITSDKWVFISEQIERNMIFDRAKMEEDNPGYSFVTKEWQYDIPEAFRIKRFPVTLEEQDIRAFETRLPNARKYLIERYNKEFAEVAQEVIA